MLPVVVNNASAIQVGANNGGTGDAALQFDYENSAAKDSNAFMFIE